MPLCRHECTQVTLDSKESPCSTAYWVAEFTKSKYIDVVIGQTSHWKTFMIKNVQKSQLCQYYSYASIVQYKDKLFKHTVCTTMFRLSRTSRQNATRLGTMSKNIEVVAYVWLLVDLPFYIRDYTLIHITLIIGLDINLSGLLPPANEVFTPVCHSVHWARRGGWLPSMHHRSHDQVGICHQGGLHRGRGLGRPPPQLHGILRDTVNKRAVRILLECFLVAMYINVVDALHFHFA